MLIGLMGFKQSGKSTAAKYLKDKYGFTRINFKDALIEEVRARFPDLIIEIGYATDMLAQYETGFGESRNFADLIYEKPPLMRALLQNYGTEVRRGDNPDYWVNQWVANLLIHPRVPVVADDVRFFNEAKAIKDNGGVLIRIVRPDILNGGGHSSETESIHIQEDYTIHGELGNPEKLYRYLDEIVTSLNQHQ